MGHLVAGKAGVPLVVAVRGYDVLMEPSAGYGVRLSKRYDLLVRWVHSSADAVICDSTALYREVRSVVDDGSRIHLIFNGADLQRFSPRDPPRS